MPFRVEKKDGGYRYHLCYPIGLVIYTSRVMFGTFDAAYKAAGRSIRRRVKAKTLPWLNQTEGGGRNENLEIEAPTKEIISYLKWASYIAIDLYSMQKDNFPYEEADAWLKKAEAALQSD